IEFSWFGSLGGACRSQPRIYKYNQTTRECQPFFQFFFELFLHPSPYKGFGALKSFCTSCIP
ncbi:hypothetical protein, partial [Crocosphaera watsonii]|uniref:hypothetical protein n=1 Tax=Crocosphaera watsonii TaxID=263511 RepID=UPI00056CCAF3